MNSREFRILLDPLSLWEPLALQISLVVDLRPATSAQLVVKKRYYSHIRVTPYTCLFHAATNGNSTSLGWHRPSL